MALFYTGKGDKGVSYIGKKKYPKDSPVFKVLGDLDELNSLLGLVKTRVKKKELVGKLERVQQDLFIIQANVAWFLYPKFKAPKFSQAKVTRLEQEIQEIERMVKPERGFIVAGANESSAWLDYLRTVSRRVERKATTMHKKHRLSKEILTYLNRLSSYLYALARAQAGKKETAPTYV